MYRCKSILFAAIAVAAAVGRQAAGQQVTVSAPFRQINEGFFERIGVSWGFNAPGINFTFNNAGLAQPPFGGYDPQAGLRTGFFVGQPGGTNAWFNIEAGQGFRRSLVTEAPVITLTNGYPGFFADASVTPFVISYIPVVGGFPPVISVDPRVPPWQTPASYGWPSEAAAGYQTNPRLAAIREKLAEAQQQGNDQRRDVDSGQRTLGRSDGVRSPTTSSSLPASQPVQPSSAVVPAPSVADARRLYAEEQSVAQHEAALLIERARAAEAAGKPQVARVYYEMAARRGTGPLKQEALERLSVLRDR